jgi:hypothetical protein
MVLRAVTALALCALAAGCGGGKSTPTRTITDSIHGLTYELPQGWQRAHVNLTPRLVDPREEMSVATFPLRYRRTACAHVAGSALEALGRGGAFVTLEERGLGAGAGFAPRPARFGPKLGGPSEASACVPKARFTDHWFAFTDSGRYFHVLVAFGPDATGKVQDQAWHILDSLKIDPRVRPDWRSSP